MGLGKRPMEGFETCAIFLFTFSHCSMSMTSSKDGESRYQDIMWGHLTVTEDFLEDITVALK